MAKKAKPDGSKEDGIFLLNGFFFIKKDHLLDNDPLIAETITPLYKWVSDN